VTALEEAIQVIRLLMSACYDCSTALYLPTGLDGAPVSRISTSTPVWRCPALLARSLCLPNSHIRLTILQYTGPALAPQAGQGNRILPTIEGRCAIISNDIPPANR
jgi:hypothetical protein